MCAVAFQEDDVPDTPEPEQTHQDQVFMLLSSAAMFGSVSPHTMQLKGSLSGRALTILVDSGSSHSFLSSTIATDIPNMKQLPSLVTVRVANGGSIVCSAEIQCVE
jgi:hypothetical protein